MLLRNIIIIAILTFLPIFELRLSIPVGVLLLRENFFVVLITVLIVNFLDAIIGYYVWKFILSLSLNWPFLDRLYFKYVLKKQKKARKLVDKYGVLGLGIFIGIPLPGSGAYTGAVVSQVMGMSFKDFLKAAIFGILMAAIIIFAVTYLFDGFLFLLGYNEAKIEMIQKMFGL